MQRAVVLSIVLAGCVTGGEEDPEVAESAAAINVCGGSLQAAINAAPQDAVLDICAGTYNERLAINGKRLHLRGVSGAGATFIDANDGGRVLDVQNVGGTGVQITGITFRDGNTSSVGGGVACRNATLTVRDSVFLENRADRGAGLYAGTCVLDIKRSRFEGNVADEGGGITTLDGTILIEDNVFVGNSAHRGGGMFIGSNAMVRNNDVIGNEGRWTAGGIYTDQHAPTIEGNLIDFNTSVNDGGGFYVHQGAPILRDNVITDNVSSDDGGGVRLFETHALVEGNVIEGNQAADGGGGVRISHVPSTFIDNVIRNNEATQGGGMDLDNDSSVVRGGVISGNHASNGGGIAASIFADSGAAFEDVQLVDNVATSKGGGLYVVDNPQPIAMRGLIVRGNSAPRGAGLYVRSTNHSIKNSLFDDNAATGDGGAIHHAAGSTSATGNYDFLVIHGNSAGSGSAIWTGASGLSLESSIVYQNAGTGVRVSAGSAPVWRYNDTLPRSFSGMTDPTGSSGNISANPVFGTDFVLTAGSPAIDAGDPAVQDVDGSRADMGMYGGPGGEAGPPPPPPPPPGDATVVLEADAHVAFDTPATNFGAATTLIADQAPLTHAYLRFAVSDVEGTVTSARLRMTVTNATTNAPQLFAAGSTWSESTITWNNRPATTGGVIADLGAVSAGQVIEYDVTALVTGDGVYTMALVPATGDGFAVHSGESATAPQLIVETGEVEEGAVAVLEADAHVELATPAANFGSAPDLFCDGDPQKQAYLRFRVTGGVAVTSAKLRLRVTDASSDSPALYAAASTWEESTLTWNNRPPISGGVIGDLGATSVGQTVEYDVSALVTGDGVYTFALVPTSGSGFGAASQESSTPPQLILTP
jgi:hypothetical protein